MKLPSEIPVMTLPNATLFPQALLPLYVFEPRYRQMLADALHSNRMFSVAMQKPGSARGELEEAVRTKPYRIQRIRPLETPPCDNVKVDALVAKVRELLEERIQLGLPFPFPVMSPEASESSPAAPPSFSPKEILNYLDSITDPEQAADLVSCAVLPGAVERQTILETVDVEARLRRLIHFLLAEIQSKRKADAP